MWLDVSIISNSKRIMAMAKIIEINEMALNVSNESG
jgi:hypothetical protein